SLWAVGGLETAEVQALDGTAAEEPLRPDRHAFCDERAEAVEQLDEAVPAGLVDRHREMRPLADDSTDEAAQDRARPDLHEHPRARAVHRVDLARELDGADEVLAEDLRDRFRILRVRLRRRVREDRNPGRRDRRL